MACKRCGKCCSRFFLLHKYEGDPEKAIYGINMHVGMLVIGRQDADHLIVAIEAPCTHLAWWGDGQALCQIYDRRPEGCRKYNCQKCEE